MSNDVLDDTPTRRSFLDFLLATATLGWLGTVVYPVLRYLKPLPQSGPTGPARLTRNELAVMEREQFVIIPIHGKRALVFRDNEQKVHAVDAKCTHEGCTVRYVPGESLIWCACHNGRFDIRGRVLAGPPPRPLPTFVAEEDEGGIVIFPQETV